MGQLSAIAALLTSVFLLIAGNSLVNTLVATRAKLEAFPQLALALLASAYFVGMLAGTSCGKASSFARVATSVLTRLLPAISTKTEDRSAAMAEKLGKGARSNRNA